MTTSTWFGSFKQLAILILLAVAARAQYTGNFCTAADNSHSTMSCTVNGVTSGNKLLVFYTISTAIGSTCGSLCASDSFGSTYSQYCVDSSSSCGGTWGFQFGDSAAANGSCNGSPCTTNLNIATLGSSGNDVVTIPNNNLISHLIVMEYAGLGSNDVSNGWCAGDALFCPNRQDTGSQSTSVTTVGNPDVIVELAACSDSCTSSPTLGGSYTQQLSYTAPFTNSSGRTMRIVIGDRAPLTPTSYTVDANVGGTLTADAIIGWSFGDLAVPRAMIRSLWY